MQQQMKTVLITGTSSGIGLAAAVHAAQHGWRTIATMRDTSRGAALREEAGRAGVEVDIRELDVTDNTSVTDAIRGVLADYGRLDAVVNNAGSAFVGTVENADISSYQESLEVNYLGPVRLIKSAMPALRASRGRIVTVSSVGGVIGQPFNEAYCAAKFAIEGFLEALHPVAATVGVDVTVIEPGAVASRFLTNAGLDPATMIQDAGPYGPALSAYLKRTMEKFDPAAAETPEHAASVIIDTLDTANPPFRVQTSAWAHEFVAAKLLDTDGSRVTSMTASWVNATSPAPTADSAG